VLLLEKEAKKRSLLA
jgi:hypothetical protein